MRKFFAITLLLIHLFNFGGYALLFQYFINQSESTIVQQLDASNYDEQSLILIKIPVQLPYLTESRQYERVDGEFEREGVHYNYVKKKISKDTLYLLCLPNNNKTELDRARHDYGNQVNSLPTDKKGNETGIRKNMLGKEYSDPAAQYAFTPTAYPFLTRYNDLSSPLSSSVVSPPYNPPEVI